MDRPNILFLVLDSCRLDYAKSHAPVMRDLGEDHLWFEKAIAPATWSLPSHVSLFTGELPHEHGVNRVNQSIPDLPLLDSLRSGGYESYGLSANGFASQKTDFDASFDYFRETRSRNLHIDGLRVHQYVDSLNEAGYSKPKIALKTLSKIATHDNQGASFGNFLSVALAHLGANHSYIQNLPTSLTDPSPYYSPEKNTKQIQTILTQEAETENPSFIFSNYMDCHRPYEPPADLQRKHVGRELPMAELERLNEDVASPWRFVERIESDDEPDVEEEDLETIRNLYAAEVESVDRHIGKILTTLEEVGLRDETLVVITADHGENLGETDAMGRRRLGHEGSVSDALLRVPLVVAHPDLEDKTVDEWASLRELYTLFTGESGDATEWAETVPTQDTDEVVIAEYPAVGGEDIFEKYPGVTRESLEDRVSVHTVVGYVDDWKVSLSSNGDEYAWKDGSEQTLESAPDKVVQQCSEALEQLNQLDNDQTELSDAEIERLEALGYM